jgi:hypothetical protein
MDRLGHQEQSRRDTAARPSTCSIAHTVGASGDVGGRKRDITTDWTGDR